ncbi:MAG TPA: hypothetical protein VGK78_16905 [Nocardioides sp.]|uniref:hypothetical protein n=1 Tax=Nocardioides sp. TaxID=35761 RepID=UPI002F42BDF0
MTPTTQALRRVSLVVGSATILLVGYAGPAAADIPDGWSNPKPVPVLGFLLVFVGIPLLITIGILAAVYLPGVVRGESVAPAGVRPEDQWFGGRRDTAQLESASAKHRDEPAPGEQGERDTGGAGGTW